jgi:hypothetical protein
VVTVARIAPDADGVSDDIGAAFLALGPLGHRDSMSWVSVRREGHVRLA